MKIIFLDVDGVLNARPFVPSINDDKVKLLAQIINATGAQIVLSSDWRLHMNDDDEDIELLKDTLADYDMNIMSCTPVTKENHRGTEIRMWLDSWQGAIIESFVILDDRIDMSPYHDRHVCTDVNYGLTRRDMKRAIRLLESKDF